MTKRPSMADIARKAGVGTATVERVLNARANVRPQTAERVILAARRLGYDRRLPELYRGIIRIEVVMVQPYSAFFRRLNTAFARFAASLPQSVHIQRTFVDQEDPEKLALHIADPEMRRSGLIICSPDDHRVRESVQAIRRAGIPVVTIVSRIGGVPDAFVGIDNYAAGRTAAHYLSNFRDDRRGPVIALCHSGVYDVHRERIRGFSDYLAEKGHPDQRFPLVVFGRDEARATDSALRHAFLAVPDCTGLYNAGGANRAVAKFLTGRAGIRGRVMWVGHELTKNSRGWLKSGLMHLVLDQAPETQARRALDRIMNLVGLIDGDVDVGDIPFITYTPENC